MQLMGQSKPQRQPFARESKKQKVALIRVPGKQFFLTVYINIGILHPKQN
jgi:hypothetical protein